MASYTICLFPSCHNPWLSMVDWVLDVHAVDGQELLLLPRLPKMPIRVLWLFSLHKLLLCVARHHLVWSARLPQAGRPPQSPPSERRGARRGGGLARALAQQGCLRRPAAEKHRKGRTGSPTTSPEWPSSVGGRTSDGQSASVFNGLIHINMFLGWI